MTTTPPRGTGLWVAAGIAVVFGALTIASGGQALFGGAAAQGSVGNAVPFVLWFNFLSGFAYVLAGIGIFLRKPWATALAAALSLAILAVYAFFGLHVLRGGAYEARTVGAMGLRAAVWIGIAIYFWSKTSPGSPHVWCQQGRVASFGGRTEAVAFNRLVGCEWRWPERRETLPASATRPLRLRSAAAPVQHGGRSAESGQDQRPLPPRKDW